MIRKIDHVVITAKSIAATTHFYRQLGFEVHDSGGRYELYAGDFKINVHTFGKELSPHARNVQEGSVDLCFEITVSIGAFRQELLDKGLQIELGVVERNGVKGHMNSIYLRDPDGNLIEFCSYE